MSEWVEQDANKMRRELENIYMLAGMKRAVRYSYPKDGEPIPIGPKSDDPDWDHVIRFCEQAGLRASLLRTMTTPAEPKDVKK